MVTKKKNHIQFRVTYFKIHVIQDANIYKNLQFLPCIVQRNTMNADAFHIN